MLSYQHAYHAGNLADVHKHALLCSVLDYLLQKEKPFSYIETHAGRGLYTLDSPEATKTGEAAAGIIRLLEKGLIPQGHPYAKMLEAVQKTYGAQAYPGSPMIAETMLRAMDKIHLAERHPQELAALQAVMKKKKAKIYDGNGLAIAKGLIPPEPRRGVMLIDPSYEVKEEYAEIASFVVNMAVKWPVGVMMVWYPILDASGYKGMLSALNKAELPKTYCHEVMFDNLTPAHHGIRGSGLFVVNAPFDFKEKAKETERLFAVL